MTSTTVSTLGGFTIPWDQLRTLFPDERWAIYAAGWVNAPGPACRVTVSYQKDDGTFVDVGSSDFTGYAKREIGPVPVHGDFAVAKGVPKGENIISIALRGALAADGTAATLTRWTMWLRMTPRNV